MSTFPIKQSPPFARRGLRTRTSRQAASYGQVSRLLDQAEFIRLLCLERKRAERSGRPFMVMVICTEVLFRSVGGSRIIQRTQQALSSSTRETDTLGWYEQGSKLAVLFTEIGAVRANVNVILGKVSSALQSVLKEEEFRELDITLHLFPRPEDSEVSDDEIDLTFYPDCSGRHESKRGAHAAKRGLDVLGSVLALIALSPAFAIISLLIRFTSAGPILFRQSRIGQYGKPFTFLKFRSMYRDCNSAIHQEYVARLIEGKSNLRQDDGSGSQVYKLTADPRVTPLGKVLRKTSLDELPQLLNVLFGKMSLVGPRPPLPYEFERYGLWHRRRILEVKPGITGLWQVNGRSKTTFDDMVRLDLKYAKAWSVWMDLKILWRTPLAVIRAEGAY